MFLIGVLALALATGCYPDKIDYVEEYDVAATLYDEAADFGSYTTFTVIDTIIHMTEDGKDDPNLGRDHDEFIVDLVRQNMRDLGYTEIENPDSLTRPDLILFCEALSNENFSYYYWGYWGWYPGWGWWYPYSVDSQSYYYPGWGYPWYPSYPWYPGYVTSYTTGTLMIEMADSEKFDPEDRTLGFVWTGLADGLLVKSNNTQSRLEKQINQMFEQSTYLQK